MKFFEQKKGGTIFRVSPFIIVVLGLFPLFPERLANGKCLSHGLLA